jgi:MFS transporter, BCD family, chlorophyll transporter
LDRPRMSSASFGWTTIVRLGLVQTMLGAIIVLMTSTINRVMVVELALPAAVPGLLVASHYAIQILRPAWGYGSDVGGRRTPWIIGGMAALALGGMGAALGTALAASSRPLGVFVAALSFLLLGIGAGSAGTSVLAMLATHVAPRRRAFAASVVWMMMILGFAISAPLAGSFLDPFSNMRLIEVTATICAIAFTVSTLAVWGVEMAPVATQGMGSRAVAKPSFQLALTEIWQEPAARRFTIFIFVSMLAYGAQELLVEPFAGLVFGMSPGATTKLAGVQHGGVFVGMVGVAVLASVVAGRSPGSLRMWTIAGCISSALSLLAIVATGVLSLGPDAFRVAVFALGISNGVFAVSAIGSMMGLAATGAGSREGTRMGLWGAAQAIAFGLGGIAATVLIDLARGFAATPLVAYISVFSAESLLFIAAAILVSSVARGSNKNQNTPTLQGALAVGP